ncbi:hypothetical protein DL766_007256 [Monosporascus sp. MC13-8B]|nr:hypothetical protein DL763_007892 [Monosporascus cannonballus]RYP24562.1 hypothetical protein DL766_007256 [Monosporascus sp. MC13-8B]
MARCCVLFESPGKSAVVMDIPRSIEEAQVLPGRPAIERRLVSRSPVREQWATPEPRNGDIQIAAAPPSAAIAELMTLETARTALDGVRSSHAGPWCLSRVLAGRQAGGVVDENKDSSRKRKQTVLVGSDEEEVIPQPVRQRRLGSPDPHAVNDPSPPFIPEQSHYLLGSIASQREAFLRTAPRFDLIVLDPPWPSRSVKRKKRGGYSTAHGMREAGELLSQIPVASHLKREGLVAVWVTNKAAVADLLTSPGGIFSQWGLEPVGEWIWLKITASGDPIVDMESRWRKPWERLLIARKIGSSAMLPIQAKVMLAVPDVHSRKPSLRGLFKDILPDDYAGLEVFARHLTAGWWSWGDEVLRFQHRQYWVESEDTNEGQERGSHI